MGKNNSQGNPSNLSQVASVNEVPPGTGKVVVVKGQEVGIFNVEGNIHAINNICPHNYRPIGTAEIEGSEVTCLWHSFKFNLKTGICFDAPQYRLRRYHVEVENGNIFIELRELD